MQFSLPRDSDGRFLLLTPVSDADPISPWLDQRNRARQYDFMSSAFSLWKHQSGGAPTLDFIGSLNFYASHLLSRAPGVVRSRIQTNVAISNTEHLPPRWEDVDALMKDFLQKVGIFYADGDPLKLSAYALWRLNWIHPFIQGNGRTARALSFFVLCQKYDMWIPGVKILPELIRENRDEYCDILSEMDRQQKVLDMPSLTRMADFINKRMLEQLATVKNP